MTISLTIATAICLSFGLGIVARHVAMGRLALQPIGVRSRRSR